MRTSRIVQLSLLTFVGVFALAICLAAFPSVSLAADGTLIDAGFESGADGALLATPPWTASGVPQHREYDDARAKTGSRSAWIQGASAGTNAGVWEAASGGMSANTAEVRAWVYFDTTTHSRLLEDYAAGVATADRATQVQFAPDGTIKVLTDRAGDPNGYGTGVYTTVGTYAVGWTQVRIVFDFATQTYTLSKRTSEAAPWTQLKAAGATGFAIPFRGTNTITATHGTLWRGLGAGQLWLDELRYSDTGITDAPVPDTTPPAAPATLAAVDRAADQGGAIDLSWTAASDDVAVTGYKLYRGTASGALSLHQTLSAATTYTDTAAATGTRYYYAVTAVDAAGNEGPRSPEASAVPADNLAPAVPSGLAAAGGTAQVSLTWSANTEADLLGYDVYCNGMKITAVPVPSPAYVDTLLPAGTYSYQVAAVDTNGNVSARCPVVLGTAAPASAGEPGTLVDGGFESGADGTQLATPPWNASGAPQHREYDNARAKVGTKSAWVQGAAAGSNAGVYETASGGMTSSGAEMRAWVYFDTTGHSRLFEDYAAGLATADRATMIQFAPDGTIKVLTDRPGNPNGYATGAYTTVGSYGVGWTQVRLVFDFASQSYRLSKRASAADPWTQLKATAASGYAIPFRGTNAISQTHGTLWRGLGSGQLWLDDLRYADSGIADPPPTRTILASASGGGSIAPAGPVTVVEGADSPTFTITPDDGYSILDVVVDNASVGRPSTYRFSDVRADHTIAATFVSTSPTDMAIDTDCASCHQLHGNYEPCDECHDFGEQHPGTASALHTPADVTTCVPCHAASLTVEHMNRTPDSGGAFECTTCHQSTAPAVRDAITQHKSACLACHPNANHPAAHVSSIASQTLEGTGSRCTACHEADVQTEHGKATSTSKAAGCDACHPAPRSTLTPAWAKGCVQGGCHAAGTAQEMHGGYAASHALPTPAPSCMGSDCHSGTDVGSLHAEASTTTPSGTRSGCEVCHSASAIPASVTCGDCHTGDLANFHGDLAVKHASAVTCLETCHSARLDTEHAAQSLTCDTCHESQDPAVRDAIDAGQTACSACHGAAHPTTAAFCTGCHTSTNGTYAGPSTYTATRHGSTTTSSRAAVQYPGTTYAAGSCANCHGSHSATTRAAGNTLCYDCHDAAGTTKPSTYSYQGSAAYASSGHGAAQCGSCHAVHGARDASGALVPSALTKAEPVNCTGTTQQPGCHASGANARNGTNILAAFNAGASANSHHDVYGTGSGKIVCSNCHDPHVDSGTSQFANPAAIGTKLPNASDRFRDANGRIYALVGAQHDGVGPIVSQLATRLPTPSDPTKVQFTWYTNEAANGYVDYGPTTAYGTTANSLYSMYTYHYVQPITFAIGTTWHYRIRTVDALGNTSVSQDYVYRNPYTQVLSGPTVTGGNNATPVTVTWTTRGACDTWVDYGPTTAYGSTTGSSSYVTTHTVTLNLPVGVHHLRARSTRDIDSYTSPDIPVTVYPTGSTAPTLTPVPSDGNMTGPKDVTFQWSQPNTTAAPFTYQLRVWDPNSSPQFNYTSSWLTTNTAVVNLDGDHNYNWTVQAKDKDGTLYPLSATGTFYLYYYSGGSGSCPFLFTWDGSGFQFESDEFAAGKLGLNTSKGFRRPNPFDYHITKTEPAVKDGALEYKLVEERAEVDYLDQVKLYTLDAPADREIWVERSQAEGVGQFTSLDAVIHTTERTLKPPVSVKHVNTGQDVTAKIAADDGDYLMLNEDRNNGYDYQTIELDLGDVKDAPMTKLVIDGRTCIPTSVAGRQRSLLFGPQVKFEVQDAAGAWKAVPTTNTILPKPPEFDRPFVLDLSKIWISDSRKVRFTYLYKTYLDAILLDTTADVPVTLTELPLESADLQPHGFDGKSTLQELYDFVYGDIVSPPYYHLPGDYTKFGPVKPLLGDIDDKFVIFGGGDELTLRFTPPSPTPANTNRRFMFVSDGYYKDLKQTIEHTVDPLPFAAMSNFPYTATEHYPDDADHQAYLAEWNTRHEDGAASPQEQSPLSSLIRALDDWITSIVAKGEAIFAPEEGGTTVASREVEDTMYSVDTDRVSLNVVYNGSATPVLPAAGWQSASSETLKPTPSVPGTAVDAATLTSASSVNGAYWRTNLTSTDRVYNWQVMRFDVPANLLTGAKALQLQWTGHGEPTSGYPVKTYLWDFQASQWVLASTVVSGSDTTLTHSERQASTETFCIACHNATPPAGASGAAAFADIRAGWDVEYHGDGSGVGGGSTLKAPYVRGNNSISCAVCHDSHGSSNAYHLKGTINGSSGITVATGVQFQNACRACHEGTVASFHQQCDDCHYYEHGWGPTIDESWDCAACHKHNQVWVHNDDSCHCGGLPSARTF